MPFTAEKPAPPFGKFPKEKSTIYITVNGQDYEGWIESRVSTSIEDISGTFDIPIDFDPDKTRIKRGDLIKVRINETQIVEGYVLSAEPFYNEDDIGIRVLGRDRCGDLAICSAMFKGGQWKNAKLDQIIRDLIKPYGIELKVERDVGAPIKEFKIEHGETVAACIARAAAMREVLVTRDNFGRLIITKAGETKAKGAIVRGANVIRMQGVGSDDERHSHYIAYGQSNVMNDFESARNQKAQAIDKGMNRYLPLVIDTEGNQSKADLQRLADHTMRVRSGHAQGIQYTVEGWAFQGEPWLQNQRVPIWDETLDPPLVGDEWLISKVDLICDLKKGDLVELTVRPIEAYEPVPQTENKSKKKSKSKKSNDKKVLP